MQVQPVDLLHHWPLYIQQQKPIWTFFQGKNEIKTFFLKKIYYF
jgi:hypothetical protein